MTFVKLDNCKGICYNITVQEYQYVKKKKTAARSFAAVFFYPCDISCDVSCDTKSANVLFTVSKTSHAKAYLKRRINEKRCYKSRKPDI